MKLSFEGGGDRRRGTVLVAGGVELRTPSSGGEEQVTGPSAEKAKAAALKQVGGGTVLEIEQQDGDGPGAYEVEVKRPDGSTVEVYVGTGSTLPAAPRTTTTGQRTRARARRTDAHPTGPHPYAVGRDGG